MEFVIRYPEKTKEEVIRLHRFVAIISQPVLFGPIDFEKSINEIHRIIFDSAYGFCLVAEIEGEIVGSLGLIAAEWWYNKGVFFTDRWFFVFPALQHSGIGVSLIGQARATIPEYIPLIINGKLARKNQTAGGAVCFQTHRLIEHKNDKDQVNH